MKKNGWLYCERDDNDKIIPLIYKALEKFNSKESPAIRKLNFR
jgi:hypothetical protein